MIAKRQASDKLFFISEKIEEVRPNEIKEFSSRVINEKKNIKDFTISEK